jgi:hypothetical protein
MEFRSSEMHRRSEGGGRQTTRQIVVRLHQEVSKIKSLDNVQEIRAALLQRSGEGALGGLVDIATETAIHRVTHRLHPWHLTTTLKYTYANKKHLVTLNWNL